MSSPKSAPDEFPYAVYFRGASNAVWESSVHTDDVVERVWAEMARVRHHGQLYAYKTSLLKLLHKTGGW